MVIENVFEQLETLAIDAEHLSLRIRCLILGCDLNHFCLMEDHGWVRSSIPSRSTGRCGRFSSAFPSCSVVLGTSFFLKGWNLRMD